MNLTKRGKYDKGIFSGKLEDTPGTLNLRPKILSSLPDFGFVGRLLIGVLLVARVAGFLRVTT